MATGIIFALRLLGRIVKLQIRMTLLMTFVLKVGDYQLAAN